MDRKALNITNTALKDSVDGQIREKELAIICIGVGDLERCSMEDDFFRWEIDRVRERERDQKLRVVVLVHGTTELVDLICGTSTGETTRSRALKKTGKWGTELLQYLQEHYVVFFDTETLESDVAKIVGLLKTKRAGEIPMACRLASD